MKQRTSPAQSYLLFFLIITTGSLLNIVFPIPADAQNKQSLFGQSASCQVKVSSDNLLKVNSKDKPISRTYDMKPNQVGLFNRISNLKPRSKVPVVVSYPQGSVGERVLLSVLDGGQLDNGKGIKVVELNSQKKVAFTFQTASDPGIYRVSLSKGYDTKVVQLWVGAEPSPIRIKTQIQPTSK